MSLSHYITTVQFVGELNTIIIVNAIVIYTTPTSGLDVL